MIDAYLDERERRGPCCAAERRALAHREQRVGEVRLVGIGSACGPGAVELDTRVLLERGPDLGAGDLGDARLETERAVVTDAVPEITGSVHAVLLVLGVVGGPGRDSRGFAAEILDRRALGQPQ